MTPNNADIHNGQSPEGTILPQTTNTKAFPTLAIGFKRTDSALLFSERMKNRDLGSE